jgi:hypothetical protein
MNGCCAKPRSGVLTGLLALALLALAACNGTAVVTMTSTASQDSFLAYRVELVSVALQSAGGKSGLSILPAGTTVDFAALTNLSEVLGAAAAAKGSYQSVLVTLDYSSARIVYDDGSLDGVALTPVGMDGRAVGRIQLTVKLDPSAAFSLSSKGASQLALDLNLAASNIVNLSAKTVTVNPVIAASSLPIDSKTVRIRGPIAGTTAGSAATATSTEFTMGVMPFNGTVAGTGKLAILTTDGTDFEVDGSESTGTAGLGQLTSLGAGAMAVAYGTLTATDQSITTTTFTPASTTNPDGTVSTTNPDGTVSTTNPDGTVSTTNPDGTVSTTNPIGTPSTTIRAGLTFTATQVLAGSSVQGGGLDRVTGIVSARSGNTLTVEDGTLIANDGTETFLGGTTFVLLGPNTLVTVFGQSTAEINSPQQISVGSSIDAFGIATSLSSNNATLDASAGRVRLDTTTASGLVIAQVAGALGLNLVSLNGRSIAPFDFAGAGVDPRSYSITTTGTLSLTNATAGAPVIVTGFPSSFGAPPPNFTASSLLDPTTIDAMLVIDWGAGTAAPFTTYNGSSIDLDVRNSSIGARHQIEVGAQLIDILTLSSDPLIVPSPTASNTVYSIDHSSSSTIENFNTYDAFVTQLQSELNGTALATGLTAVGQYTAATPSFAATNITLTLNN